MFLQVLAHHLESDNEDEEGGSGTEGQQREADEAKPFEWGDGSVLLVDPEQGRDHDADEAAEPRADGQAESEVIHGWAPVGRFCRSAQGLDLPTALRSRW